MVHPYSHRVPRVRRYSGFSFAAVLFRIRDSHPFLLTFPCHSARFLQYLISCPYPRCISTSGLAFSAFARHYLRNLGWFLFLALLRCFSSGGSPHIPIDSVYDVKILLLTDCSIRTSADQYLLAIPRSFSQLTTSFIGSQCQGILPALLLAWPFRTFVRSWSELCFSSLEVFYWNCSFATLSLKSIWN